MDRLTERTSDGILVKEDCGENVLKTLYQCYGAEPMTHYANCDEGYCAMEKLAEYEDLEEQCIKENSWCLKMLLHKWKEFIDDIQELYEYRKLEERGKLLKLQYALNDTVYYLDDITPFEEMPIEGRISGFRVTWCGTIVIHITTHFDNEGCLADQKGDIDVTDEDFGKTVFLTKEAAEAALKEMGE